MIERQTLIAQLENIEIYKKFSTLIPYVGENYTNAKNKLLIIAESHYFPKNSEINISQWYDLSEKIKLADHEWKMITTKNVLTKYKKKKKNPLSFNIVESFCG